MIKNRFNGPLEQISTHCWRIPRDYKPNMRVEGLIYASEKLIEQIRNDQAPEQVANVACIPGIQKASLAMPDIHWGYGFCIGGVCATDPDQDGIISPGGVGYDINCGVRLIRSNLDYSEVQPFIRKLISQLFRYIPTGIGRKGHYPLSDETLIEVLLQGPRYFVDQMGLGCSRDIEFTEAEGRLKHAQPDKVSTRARARGTHQCGTLGSGNHFLEVQVVDHIEDAHAASVLGLHKNQICILIHSGSRGLGHQVCTDYLDQFQGLPQKYGIHLPDRQLSCAPALSPEGCDYIGAMRAAANFAWANRHLLMVQARQVFENLFKKNWEDLDLHLVYDVAHNIAKLEHHHVDGKGTSLWVHRKGATRAFPAHHPEIPSAYQEIGQPVIIPGSMGTASWLLVGQSGSMDHTFGSTCHGAGRQMSRSKAMRDAISRTGGRKKQMGELISREPESRGVIALARSAKELAEEHPHAYKDVDQVVDVVDQAGLSKKVARLRPVGVIKG